MLRRGERLPVFGRLARLGRIPGYGALALLTGLFGLGFSFSSPYWVLYLTTVLRYSVPQAGLLLAVGGLGGVVAAGLIASRTDRWPDRRPLIVVAALANAARYVAFVTIHAYVAQFLVGTILSMCAGPGMPQIFAAGRDAVVAKPDAPSAFALSTLRSLFSLGFVVGPALGSAALVAAGYHGVLLGSAALFVVVTGVVFFLPLARGPAAATAAAPQRLPPPAVSVRSPVVAVPFLAFAFFALASWINNFDMPLFVVHALGRPAHDAGYVVSVSAALEIPLMIWLGSLAGRTSTRAVVAYGTPVAILGYTVIGLATHLWTVLAAQLCQAAFIAVFMGVGVGFFQDLIPGASGVAATAYSNALAVGQVAGSLMGSVVAQDMGYRDVYWVCVGLVALGVGTLRLSPRAVPTWRAAERPDAGVPAP